MKFTTPLLVGAAILSLGGAAMAQPAPAAGAMSDARQAGPRDDRGDHHRDPAKMTAQRAQHLRDALQLTSAQEPALTAFLAAMASPAEMRDKKHGERGERAKMTTPQRLEHMKTRMAERQARFGRSADATLRFYGQLSPSQKKAFDAMAPMGGHGGGHRMGGHRG